MTTPFRKLDVSPYTDENLYSLGNQENWTELQRVIAPLTNRSFAVVNGFKRALVDDTRMRFDASAGGDNKSGAILNVVTMSDDGQIGATEVLKKLLAIGVDPDLPDEHGWRPSHACAYRGNLEMARLIFFCRPNMNAKTGDGDTPLEVAEKLTCKDDEQFPHRPAIRKEVADFMKNSGFDAAFPTIAELALKKHSFAVMNLIRRQVVSKTEYQAVSYGKTADEWALHHKMDLIAEELSYYESLPSVKALADMDEKIKRLKEQISLKESLKKSLTAEVNDAKKDLPKLEKQAAHLRRQSAQKDKKIAELTKTAATLSARLGELDGENAESGGSVSSKKAKQ